MGGDSPHLWACNHANLCGFGEEATKIWQLTLLKHTQLNRTREETIFACKIPEHFMRFPFFLALHFLNFKVELKP